ASGSSRACARAPSITAGTCRRSSTATASRSGGGGRLLRLRVSGRDQQRARDGGGDPPVALPLRAPGVPLPVGLERGPLLLALGEVLPLEHVVQVVVAVADQHRPEADLADAVALPDAERRFLEALVQVRQASGEAAVDAQLVHHRIIPPAGPASRA